MSLFLLEPTVQHYAWGDARFIPRLLGRENPEGLPFAELWMGAHPDSPARVDGMTLRELIVSDPESILGTDAARTFGGELPFLIKVLSAGRPLSVQAHPEEEQARAGYAREEAAGVPLGAPHRSYKDPNGKPELVVALTDFYALVGFRPLEEIHSVLEEVPELHRLARNYEPNERGIRDLFQKWMTLPQSEIDAILGPIVDRLKRRSFDRDRREFWMVHCDGLFARDGHHDRGVLSALFLNLVHLRWGEGVHLSPGVLHAYLEGSGIEVMASSNNVLRGGLTDKHIDVEELARILVFAGKKPEILRPERASGNESVYPASAKEFELSVIEVSPERPYHGEESFGAEILLVLDGELQAVSGEEARTLGRGQSVFVSHATPYRIQGHGTLYKAAVPYRSPRFRGRRPKELAFGTSGLRGLTTDITDLEVFVDTRGFLDYLLTRREIHRGDPVSLAGDLRPSTERILTAASRAIQDGGFRVEYLGRIPTPALTYAAISRGRASVMVTGSHIPFDRNGIKFNRPTGEILKADEVGVLASVAEVRAIEYRRKETESPFGADGMLREPAARALPVALPTAREAYLGRYLDFFPEDALSGKRVVFYQHSAVGRDLLVELLKNLGAEVLPMNRAETFVAVDTEDVAEERLKELERLAEVARDTIGEIDAIVSTDGDSDRPLVVGIAPDGGVRFAGGDLLGILVADYLGVDAVVVPVNANDAVDVWSRQKGIELRKSRIGSPYVISGIEALRSEGRFHRIVGWEANGGFLVGSDIERNGRRLAALPTRDAALPIVAVLHATVERRASLVDLFSRLPPRFGKAGLIDRFARTASEAVLNRFAGASGARELSRFFTPELGFGAVERTDETDGLRIYFTNGDVAHVRASGNAPQLRIYALASSQERANEIVRAAIAEPDGILRRMERAVTDRRPEK
jgi:phosphomannomutase